MPFPYRDLISPWLPVCLRQRSVNDTVQNMPFDCGPASFALCRARLAMLRSYVTRAASPICTYSSLALHTTMCTTHLRRTCGVGMYLIIRSVRAPATASCALPSRMELDDFISHQHVDPFHHYRDTLCGNRSDWNLLDALLPWAVIQELDASSSHLSMLSSAER